MSRIPHFCHFYRFRIDNHNGNRNIIYYLCINQGFKLYTFFDFFIKIKF